MNTFNTTTPLARPGYSGNFDWSAYLLGFALSGFFDGILLHQILQWHHLLSAIRSGPLGDLRFQVMADGLFHALMYLIAAIGLWKLYRTRGELTDGLAHRRLMANFWIGFGVWHVVDALLSHWLLGIHRIRMDSDVPLAWDLAWLMAFGVVPLIAGVYLRKRRAAGGTGGGPQVVMMMVGAVALGAVLNLFPLRPVPSDTVAVVLRPGVSAASLWTALDGTNARVVWTDAGGGVWVLAGVGAADILPLYRSGAMYVSGSMMPAGCAAWFKPDPERSI
jgi:uncharacterized membrane protein